MKATVGINPLLMMPGNYARQLFDSSHDILFANVESNERKQLLGEFLTKFIDMRCVYRCANPLVKMPEKVKNYKKFAVETGAFLITHFEYAKWPNYLHKVIEHVQQLIEDPRGPGSVGEMSSEGNEAGNKLFRHFRKNLARRGSTAGGLRDVLVAHWLYSSYTLASLAEVEHKKQKCSVCYLGVC